MAGEYRVGHRLRGSRNDQTVGELRPDSVGSEYQRVERVQWNNRGLQGWQFGDPDHAGAQQQLAARGQHGGIATLHDPGHIADSQPAQRGVPQVDTGDAEDHAAGQSQCFMAAPDERDGRVLRALGDGRARYGRRGRRLIAVPDPVDDPDDRTAIVGLHDLEIARVPMAGRDEPRHGASQAQVRHLVTVTVVPAPTVEAISNSSIRRLTPGSPSPNPPELE